MRSYLVLLSLLSVWAHAQDADLPGHTEIMLQRTGCLGTCPEYKLIIHANGSVVYEGRNYVHIQGVRKSKLSPSAVQALTQKFIDAKFFDMRGGSIVIDAPVTTVSFAFDGRRNEVKEGCTCPSDLVKLEAAIDEAAGSARWVRGRLRMLLHWPWIRP
jgi:hypothetical protein